MKSLDKQELRSVLGAFVTGVTVVTTVDDEGRAYGLTANSFSSVSLDPPLVLWSQSLSAPSHRVFRDAKRFAINILSESQIEISRRFSSMGGDKFADTPVRPGLGGIPLIEGCAAYIECSIESALPGGDHTIFIGRVERIDRVESRPLAFGGGRYLVARPHDLEEARAPQPAPGSLIDFHRHAVPLATEAAGDLAHALDQAVAVAVWGNHGPTVVHWRRPAAAEAMAMHLPPGFVIPVSASATGLAFAAHLPPGMTDKPLRAERGWRDGTGIEQDEALSHTLQEARARRMARVVQSPAFVDVYGGAINALSAPVFDRGTGMVLALSVVGSPTGLDADWNGRPAQALSKAAAALSRRLGHAAQA